MDFDSASEGENYGLDSKVDSQWTPDGEYYVLFEKASGDLYLQQFDSNDHLVYHIDSWGQLRPRTHEGEQYEFEKNLKYGFEMKTEEGSFTPCEIHSSNLPYFLEGHCDIRPTCERPEAPKDDFDTDVKSLHDENLEQKTDRSLARLNERRLDTQRGKLWKRDVRCKRRDKELGEGYVTGGLSERQKGNHGALGPVEKDDMATSNYGVCVDSNGNVAKHWLSSPKGEQMSLPRMRLYL